MIFKDFIPTPVLREYIRYYRLRHFIIPPNIEIHPKPYPVHPEQCIAFYLKGYEITEITETNKIVIRPRSVLTGQFTGRINRKSSPSEFLMILVVFKPGGFYKLTGIPSSEFLNKHIDLETIFNKEAREVNEILANCIDYNEMINKIDYFLEGFLRKIKIESRPIDEVFGLILENRKKYSLDWLSSQACLSTRQFERISNQYIGLSPKLFARIARFNQSYNIRLKFPEFDWLRIAMACGYYDYQHLVRDYKEFASSTPNSLFTDESKVLERVLGLNK